MGDFSSLHIARKGILANQRAMDVTAHNIANANTEGYSRQRAVFETSLTYYRPSLSSSLTIGQVGTGVQVTRIERVRDIYLDRQAVANNSERGFWDVQTEILQHAEVAFPEPTEHGLQKAMDNFFSAWYELNQNPKDSGARAAVRETARTLADRFKMSYQQLQETIGEINDRLFEENSGLIDTANRLAEEIAYYNGEIAHLVNHGGSPNDLMDKRDMLVEELAELMDIKVERKSDGTVTVKINATYTYTDGGPQTKDVNIAFIDGEKSLAFEHTAQDADNDNDRFDDIRNSTGKDAGESIKTEDFIFLYDPDEEEKVLGHDKDTHQILDAGGNPIEDLMWDEVNEQYVHSGNKVDNVNLKLTSGLITGLLGAEAKVRSYMEDLDKLAYKLVDEINTMHTSGYTLNLETGVNFFEPWPGYDIDNCEGAAGEIEIHSDIEANLSNIAASGDSSNPEDGANALEIAQLQEESISELDGSTLFDFYGSIVTRVGVDVDGAQTKLNVKEGAQEQIDMLRQSISGVNLDEEMTDMIRFQRAYQASARVIVTVDRMLEELIDLVR